MSDKPSVLFVCVHNAGRSQMAQGWLRHLAGDAWARAHLDPYVQWAQAHNSALIVTFDEDDGSDRNRILTLINGARTTPGRYNDPATHYSLLATVESWFGLDRLGHAAAATALPHAWD
jgi:acid phosphatase